MTITKPPMPPESAPNGQPRPSLLEAPAARVVRLLWVGIGI